MGAFAMQHGPGTENAYGGVAQAFSESVPLLVLPMGYARRLAHIPGNYNAARSMQDISKSCEALMLADGCPNVYLDTSSSNSWIKYTPGLTLEQVFKTALDVAGPDRLIFGTDSSFFPRGWHRMIYDQQRTALTAAGVGTGLVAGTTQNGTDRVLSTTSLGVVDLGKRLGDARLVTPIGGLDGSGNGQFTLNGVTISYNANDSISAVLNRINASNAGATASYDPTQDRIRLTASQTGARTLSLAAFLFGSERFGMANEDVYRCHVALSIPTNPGFGSLNLGAAIQVIAYEWRQALGGFTVESATPERPLADAAQVAGMLVHWEQALTAIGFLDPAAPKKLMPRLNQLFNRAQLAPEEIHILRGVAKAMIEAAGAKR